MPARSSCRVAAAVLAVMLAASATRAEEPRAMTMHDVAKARYVGDAVISPDGKLIAYTLNVPRDLEEEEDGPQWTELHVIDAAGKSRPYVSGRVNVGAVKWAGDSQRISFTAKRGDDEHGALYVIDVSGGEARRVLEFEGGIGAHSWRPGGKQVAFISSGAMPKERKNLRDKGFSQEIFEEDRLEPALWIADVGDGRGEGAAAPRKMELPGFPSDPVWSPTGDRLALALAPTPTVDDSYMRRKFHVVDGESGRVLAKLDTPGKIGPLAWSPDGTRVALIASEDLHDPAPGRLYVAPAAGGSLEEVLPAFEGHVRSVAWSGKDRLLYQGDQGVETHLGEIDLANESRVRTVTSSPASIGSVSVSKDGENLALVANSSRHGNEVFAAGRADFLPRRLTDTNPWMSGIRLASQEVVTYEARDGLSLQGLLIRPLDEVPGTRYPLVIVVHGGPESHYKNGWLTWYANGGQVLAARGFAVFYPNYRASTGRGVAFSKLDHGDFGGKEFDDLVDAADHLAATGLVDRKKVGVTGGSYGGYASAWCATALTEHFAASVMSVGLSDQVSFAGTTDIPNEMVLVHFRKHPWEDWDLYRERSPIYHTPKARTPILILHGKEDTRVHPSQSLELYRYLKVLGKVPVRLVLYPGEGHGNRRAASRLDYSLRMLRWMEHYLKGPGGEPPPYAIDYGIDLGRAGGEDE